MKKIVIVTEMGMILKMESSDVRTASRAGKGVKGINLEDGDKVAASYVIDEE